MPVILYNTGRSKKPLTPDLLKRLLDEDLPLIGCKGVASQDEAAAFLNLAPGLRIFVGEDKLADWWHAGSARLLQLPGLCLPQADAALLSSSVNKAIPRRSRSARGCSASWEEFVIPLLQEGFTDTAFDRTFAAATGFLTGELLCEPSSLPFNHPERRGPVPANLPESLPPVSGGEPGCRSGRLRGTPACPKQQKKRVSPRMIRPARTTKAELI